MHSAFLYSEDTNLLYLMHAYKPSYFVTTHLLYKCVCGIKVRVSPTQFPKVAHESV